MPDERLGDAERAALTLQTRIILAFVCLAATTGARFSIANGVNISNCTPSPRIWNTAGTTSRILALTTFPAICADFAATALKRFGGVSVRKQNIIGWSMTDRLCEVLSAPVVIFRVASSTASIDTVVEAVVVLSVVATFRIIRAWAATGQVIPATALADRIEAGGVAAIERSDVGITGHAAVIDAFTLSGLYTVEARCALNALSQNGLIWISDTLAAVWTVILVSAATLGIFFVRPSGKAQNSRPAAWRLSRESPHTHVRLRQMFASVPHGVSQASHSVAAVVGLHRESQHSSLSGQSVGHRHDILYGPSTQNLVVLGRRVQAATTFSLVQPSKSRPQPLSQELHWSLETGIQEMLPSFRQQSSLMLHPW